jgi:hypothetical protein
MSALAPAELEIVGELPQVNGMAMKMTAQVRAPARDAGSTDGPANAASSVIARPRVLAIRTSTPVVSAEPMFPVPAMP